MADISYFRHHTRHACKCNTAKVAVLWLPNFVSTAWATIAHSLGH